MNLIVKGIKTKVQASKKNKLNLSPCHEEVTCLLAKLYYPIFPGQVMYFNLTIFFNSHQVKILHTKSHRNKDE